MNPEYIIIDNTITLMNKGNIIEEHYVYSGNNWVKTIANAQRYTDVQVAINTAQILKNEGAVRVLQLQTQGNTINVAEVNF